MFKAIGIAAICAACAAPAMAGEKQGESQRSVAPLPHNFDLAQATDARRGTPLAAERAMAIMPRQPAEGFPEFTPPAMAVKLAEDGPVLAIGAMGAKFKDAPRLAHVAIGMDF